VPTSASRPSPGTSTRPRLRAASAAIPRRPFGSTGETVSALGMGGYHLGEIGTEREAISLVHEAIDAGITFMDNAWEYHEGTSERRLGKALAKGRR
jgi:aryl-alcohol dehydrogenase-like predicted oxidoreductase